MLTSGHRANVFYFHRGWGSKQTGSHVLSQWLIWKKGRRGAKQLQDAKAAVEKGLRGRLKSQFSLVVGRAVSAKVRKGKVKGVG